MSRRNRKLLGTVLIILFVPVYAMILVEISRYAVAGAPWWLQAPFFLFAGLGWALPILPMIRWMEKLTPEEEAVKIHAP